MWKLVDQHIDELPAGISFVPEELGLVPRALPESGVIFRAIPKEIRQGRVIIAPLFALMGASAEHPPLLLQLMERMRLGAREVLEGVMLAKFSRLWMELAFDFGLFLEAHAQDLLLALSPDLVPLGGFYYRDFEGLAVDWELRRAKGLPVPNLPHVYRWFSTYETWGYPRYQLVSTKMRISLFDYLNFVLGDLESALLKWHSCGVIREKIREGELTFLFSRYMRKAIQEKFGVRETEEYDIRRQLNRFVVFLMRVRREVIHTCAEGE